MVAARRDHAEAHAPADHVEPTRGRHDLLVKQHERSTGGEWRADGVLAAKLAAQQPRELIGALADEHGVGELQDLPGAVRPLHRRGIRAAEHAQIGRGRERAAVEFDACGCDLVPAARRPRRQIVQRLARHGGRRDGREWLIARAIVERTPNRRSHPARDWRTRPRCASTGGSSPGNVGSSRTVTCAGPSGTGGAGGGRRGGSAGRVNTSASIERAPMRRCSVSTISRSSSVRSPAARHRA